MIRLSLFILALLTWASCTNEDTTKESPTTSTDTTKTSVKETPPPTTFRLEPFKQIPDTIDGCGEYFTYDTSDVKQDRYIFLSNLTEFGIIKVKGQDIYLQRDSTESREVNEKQYIAVYKGNGFKAILSVTKTKPYDEGGYYEGTLEIIGEKVKVVFKVHGEAGC